MPSTCIFPSCTEWVQGRGLCQKHYSTASWLVRQGRTSWAALEAAGKALPTRRGHSPEVDHFLAPAPHDAPIRPEG